MDFEQVTSDRDNPLDLFKDKLDQINDLGAMQHIYQQLSTRTSKAPPEAIEYAKQRLTQLTEEDKIDLTAPINRAAQGVAGSLGYTMTKQLPEMSFSKAGFGRGVDKAIDIGGGLGLALLSASEGFRGKPLTEAMAVNQGMIDRERIAEQRTHHQAQLAMEQRKQHDAQRKELFDLHKTYGPRVKAMVRTGNDAGLNKIESELVGLYGDRQMVKRVMSVWKANPTNFDAFMELVKQGKMGDAWDMTNSLGEDVDLALKVLSDPKHVAAIRNAAHALKPKEYPPLTDDERKAGGLQTTAEQSIDKSTATIKGIEAENMPEATAVKQGTAEQALQKARRELAQQDLEEYSKILNTAIKLAGGGGMSFSLGAGGGISDFTMGDMSKIDQKKLAAELKRQAKVAPGISAATKAALYEAAADIEAGEKVLKFDKRGKPIK